jgi:DNA-binding transcriptional LysR family regulator
MDRLTSLTAFVWVVDSGGFSAAGRRLNMSTTMISNYIQSLESRLGTRLLNRTTRKVSLTETGRACYDRYRQALADLDRADDLAKTWQTKPRGLLRVCTIMQLGPLIAPVMVSYLGRHPEVQISLTVAPREIDIIDERYDVAVRLYPSTDSRMIVRDLATWQHVLCCSPAYLEKHGPISHPSELAERNCLSNIGYPPGDDWYFVDQEGAAVAVRTAGNLATDSGETLRAIVLQGDAICLAEDFLVRDDFDAGRLIRLLPQYSTVEFTMSAACPDHHRRSANVQAFMDMLVDYSFEQKARIGACA